MRTKVSRNTSRSESLKSTIPEAVVESLKIKRGDFLDWDIIIKDDRLVVMVKKVDKVD